MSVFNSFPVFARVSVPMEEIVRAFNFVIEQGWAFYWATSEWSAREIEEAHRESASLLLNL